MIRLYRYTHINTYNFIRSHVRSFVRRLRIASSFRGKSTHLMWEESKHWLQFLCVSVSSAYVYVCWVCCWWRFLFVCCFFGCVVLIVSSQRHTRFRNILGLGTRSYVAASRLLLLLPCRCMRVCVPVRLPLFVYTSSSATFFVPLFLILPPFAHNANKPTKRERTHRAHIFKVVATMNCVDKYICIQMMCRRSGVSGFVSYHFVYNTSNET